MIYNTIIPLIKSIYQYKINPSNINPSNINIDIEKGNNSVYSILNSIIIYNDELIEIIIQQ